MLLFPDVEVLFDFSLTADQRQEEGRSKAVIPRSLLTKGKVRVN